MTTEGQSESQVPQNAEKNEADTVTMPPVTGNTDDATGAEPLDLFADESVSRAFDQSARSTSAQARGHKGLWIIIALLVLLILLLVGGFYGARHYFQDRVAPGVTFAGQYMMGKDLDQVRKIVKERVDDSKVELEGRDRVRSQAGLTDLGVGIDQEATVKNLMNAKRQGDLDRLNPFHRISIPLVAREDDLKLDQYLTKTLIGQEDQSVPSTIVFNEDLRAFQVKEGRGGKSVKLDPVKDAISSLIQDPGRVIRVRLSFQDVPVPISKDVATQVAGQANQRISKDLVIEGAADDKMTVPAQVVASWVKPETDLKKGTMSLDFDREAVLTYLTDQMPKNLDREMVTAVTIKNTQGNVVAETTKGVDGVKVKDIATTADQVIQALKSGNMEPVRAQADLTPHKEQSRIARYDVPDGDTWIDVNLSNQTATVYRGTTVEKTFPICSGKPYDGNESDTGTFFINVRYQVQTMRGPGYVSPNVKWVSYYNGSEGFHTADWNYEGIALGDPTNYGSHGCINMYEQDAKWVFDNAPAGTMVKVSGLAPSGPTR